MSTPNNRRKTICQYFVRGTCRFGNRCWNIHSQNETPSTHSTNATPDTQSIPLPHNPNPASQVPNETRDKSCGICFEMISEKAYKDQTFGILPNCNHCYCFQCIQLWRRAKNFDLSVLWGCPECRVQSDFVFRSRVWFSVKEEKDAFISSKKTYMQTIHCTRFKNGKGRCPFGNACLYLHALPDGTKLDVGPPKAARRRMSLDYELIRMLWDDDIWLHLDSDDDIGSSFEDGLDSLSDLDSDNELNYFDEYFNAAAYNEIYLGNYNSYERNFWRVS